MNKNHVNVFVCVPYENMNTQNTHEYKLLKDGGFFSFILKT